MKRLVNSMDFEALEVKMKKCKVCGRENGHVVGFS